MDGWLRPRTREWQDQQNIQACMQITGGQRAKSRRGRAVQNASYESMSESNGLRLRLRARLSCAGTRLSATHGWNAEGQPILLDSRTRKSYRAFWNSRP